MHFTADIDDPGGTVGNWLLCGSGSFFYALPLAQVVEVMPLLRIDPIAGAPPCVRGLCAIRGMPVPVVDVAFLVDGRLAPCQRLVTIKAGTRIVALAVDKVLGVRPLEANEPPHPLLRDIAGDLVAAIGRLDAELLLFLDTARIVPDTLLDRLENLEVIA